MSAAPIARARARWSENVTPLQKLSWVWGAGGRAERIVPV